MQYADTLWADTVWAGSRKKILHSLFCNHSEHRLLLNARNVTGDERNIVANRKKCGAASIRRQPQNFSNHSNMDGHEHPTQPSTRRGISPRHPPQPPPSSRLGLGHLPMPGEGPVQQSLRNLPDKNMRAANGRHAATTLSLPSNNFVTFTKTPCGGPCRTIHQFIFLHQSARKQQAFVVASVFCFDHNPRLS